MSYQYIFSGTLPQNTPTYIERKADYQLYQQLKRGEFCYVFNSRKTGKSSLRVRTMSRLQQENFACAAIDLSLDEVELATPEQWYFGIVYNLSEDLGLEIDLYSWWNERSQLSPLARLGQFIKSILLKQIATNVVIFIDEIDSVLSLNFPTDDFFAFIRGCYNLRADNPDFNRLGICLLGVTAPTFLIQDKKRTPFNIGQSIELTGFTFTEAKSLTVGLQEKVDNPQKVLAEILFWTGGQPFLTQKLCYLIALGKIDSTKTVSELVQTHIIDNWEYQDEPEHLKTIRDRILSNRQRVDKLLEVYQQVLEGKSVRANDSLEILQLKLSGLVIAKENQLQVYNPIYRQIFDQIWIETERGKICPYSDKLTSWLESKKQDTTHLLNRAELQQAQQWAAGKSLSSQYYQFLNASLDFERQKAEREAEGILSSAKRKASKQTIAGLIFSIFALLLGGWATRQILNLEHQKYIELEKRISSGEKILLNSNLDNNLGAKRFSQGNFTAAQQKFAVSQGDSEALIYFNNAKAANNNPLTIAVAIPIGKNNEVAKQMLRGIAQAQQEVNQNCSADKLNVNCGINGQPLKIKIAQDNNDPQIAATIANHLVKDREVLAVVGHNASDVSTAAAEEYRDKLVMISPTSFFADFPRLRKTHQSKSNYIFRTVPSLDKAIEHIVKYIALSFTDERPKLLICYDSSAVNSKAHLQAFQQFEHQIDLLEQLDCDFNRPEFEREQTIQQAINLGANSLFLAPHIDRINEAIAIAKVNHRQPKDSRLKLFGGAVLYTPKTLEDLDGRQAIKGMLLNVFWHSQVKTNHQFLNQAQQLWGKQLDHNILTWRSAMSYDATLAIVEAAKKTSIPTRKKIQQILSQPDFSFQGATGLVKFEAGERLANKAFLVEVQQSDRNIDFVPFAW